MSTPKPDRSHLQVLDLFAGAGGFSLGAHRFTDDVLGIELNVDACQTQLDADMLALEYDITALNPRDYRPADSSTRQHLHASPPCQSFSSAGKGKGRVHLDLLCDAVTEILATGETTIDVSELDPNTQLVLQPAYWIRALEPVSISMEQVRAVLPVWEAYAAGLEQLGYSAWTSLLHAEQYGVPQTRTRAWLGACRGDFPVEPPTPTHSRFYARKPEKLDPDIAPWVSMAEALGWGMTTRASFTLTAGGTGTGGAEPFPKRARDEMGAHEARGDWVGFPRLEDGRNDGVELNGVEYRRRDLRPGEHPAHTLTEKARSWSHVMQGGVSGEGQPRPVSRPAPTLGSKGTAVVTDDPDAHYGYERRLAKRQAEATPATTIQGDDRVWPRGHKVNQRDIDRLGEEEAKARYGDRAGSTARRVTIEEAGVLQGFPPDYPWHGTKTSQFRQCGNAVNPIVAARVLETVLPEEFLADGGSRICK